MDAKQKLSNFDFSKKGCHISLVGPSLGGPANGVPTLVLKSLSPEGATKNPHGEGNEMTMIEKSAVETMVQKAVEEAVAVFKSQAETAQKELELMKAAQVAQVTLVRKAKLVAVLGEVKADETLAVLKSLDDTAFEIVLKGYADAKDVEDKSAMFKEKGVDGKADLNKITADAESNPVMDYLKSKYQPK